jgi:hypothetical protein
MELLITLGRDCVVAYQNEDSAKIDVLIVGSSIIKRTFLISAEEIRDSIFSGKTLSFSNRSYFHHDRELLLTRDYRPLRGPSDEIIGIVSMGWSRPAPIAEDYSDLSAIISALESPGLPIELSASRPLAASSHRAPSDYLALARRLRRFLPQQVH